MKTIVVTGGAGFIGSHLCRALLKDSSNKVICVDNLFTGSVDNIREFLDNPRFRFINHDIINPLLLEEPVIDQIYNLACPASPVHYQHDAISTIKTNVLGVTNMLGMAKKHKARILQASTSEVYGDPTEHPQKETYLGNVNPISIRGCYDEGKRCAETLMFDYNRQNHVDIRIARIFNTYGPQMSLNDGRVVSNFITQALKGEDITIYGDGTQSRSFCFVSDLVAGLIALMNKDGFYGPVNLGNPTELTMNELADTIIKMTGSSSKKVLKPLPEADPKIRQPDISLAKAQLGWTPSVSLSDGLQSTIEYFRAVLGK